MLERHIMGITAAQFVWSPAGDDANPPDAEAASSGGQEMQCLPEEGGEDTAPKRRRPEKNESIDHDNH